MNQPELRVLWLYPDILNLHGDRGNAMALDRICQQAGVLASIRRVNRLTEKISLADTDLILMGPGELAVMPDVVRALSPYAAQFEDYLAADKVMLVTGTSAAIVATSTTRCDGSHWDGLGWLDMTVAERGTIYGDDLILAADDLELTGIQIRMTDLKLAAGQAAFAQVVYGLGNTEQNPAAEGAQRRNLIATNLLGPALVKNPWFTWALIERALIGKYGQAPPRPSNDQWSLERQGAEAVRQFCATKQTPPGVLTPGK